MRVAIFSHQFGCTGWRQPAATVLHSVEQFLDRGLAHLLFQLCEQICLQRLARPAGAVAQDLVNIRWHVLDLHAGHPISLAPFWRHCADFLCFQRRLQLGLASLRQLTIELAHQSRIQAAAYLGALRHARREQVLAGYPQTYMA